MNIRFHAPHQSLGEHGVGTRQKPLMVKDQDAPPSLDFPIDRSLSKRPDQLAALLDSALRREFPEALDIVEIAQLPNPPVVSLRGLEKLEESAAKRLAHRARAVFNDFMISPWY